MLDLKHVLLFMIHGALARDLSLHLISIGEANQEIRDVHQRSLRQIKLRDASSTHRVNPLLLRQAMKGGAALSTFASFDLPNNMSLSKNLVDFGKDIDRIDEVVEEGSSELGTSGSDKIRVAREINPKVKPANATVLSGNLHHQFDFVVSGFPKCGTTTLLKAFAANHETDMVPQELCAIAAPSQADHLVVSRLKSTILDMSTVKAGSTWHKQGFKCPTAVYNYKSIARLEKHSPNAKIIIGIRHPIHMLQSFYNYRVTELYERGQSSVQTIPLFSELMKDNAEPWRGVSIHAVRFEYFLQQLGKTSLDRSQLEQMGMFSNFGHELAVRPSNFTVFCYTVDQLEDSDDHRSEKFRASLQRYLGLTTPLAPFGHENKNHAVGSTGHPESIRICDEEFSWIRKTVLKNAKKTASWIRNDFLESPDVFVGNTDHFLESLQKWETDPCETVHADIM